MELIYLFAILAFFAATAALAMAFDKLRRH